MAKRKTAGKNQLLSSIKATVAHFRRLINPPYKTNEFASLFAVLFILTTIPLIVFGAINRQNLVSKAKSTNCTSIIPSGDTEKPFVQIESPSEGQYLTEKGILIKAKVKDNFCLKKVSLLIDGATIKTFKAAPFIYFWNLQRVEAGSHMVAVRAIDTSGNLTVSSASTFKSAKSMVAP